MRGSTGKVLEYPGASGYISTWNAWRGCCESLEDGWSVVCDFRVCWEIFDSRNKYLTSGQPRIRVVDTVLM